jgi:outer membrane protein OmpA-like peptidoglycan-associated protein
MPRLPALCAAILLLAGCTTAPPRASTPPTPIYAAPQPQHIVHAPRPAPVATLAAPRAVKPIGAGQLVSANVEAYMDNQESELRGALRGGDVTVGRLGDALVLNLHSDALFAAGSLSLTTRGSEVLTRVAQVVRKFDSTRITVNGYTDTTGTEAQNLQVSQKRADAVAGMLAEQGVDPHRLAAKGYGESILRIPTGANVTEARNRRIEIRITPDVKA